MKSPMLFVAAMLVLTATATRGDDAPPALSAAQQTAVAELDARAAELVEINHALWEFAEVGLQEHRSAALLVDTLQENGFDVEEGVSGMPTAFVASYGEGAPIIGILAEYDALPGMSQQAVPYREPLEPGAAGHACGHSGLGTAAVEAAIAVRLALEQHALPGTIRLYGTPAEETVIGKIYMLLDKQFDDLDVCLHWHPGDKNMVWAGSSKASLSVKFRFHGVSAHASSSPHEGRSALDAVELMNIGVNFMREHVQEDCRLHYVITDGGGQPNVVPPEAAVWYYIRANAHTDMERYYAWVQDIARGAAQMTRTTLDVHVDTDCHELIANNPLSEMLQSTLLAVGPPTFTPEEHAFAARLQEPIMEQFGKVFPNTLNEDVKPLTQAEDSKGSTDVGDISWHVPTGGIRTTCMAAGSPGHSWQNVASIGSPIGDRGTLYAAKVLAAGALRLYEDEPLRIAARADFESRMKDRKYTSLIPAGQTAPQSIR